MYQKICTLHDLVPELGVPALVNGQQVAIFRLKDNRVFAVSTSTRLAKPISSHAA
jgi:nitrite reductase/ring-hydroxylating ferredoxin subunit